MKTSWTIEINVPILRKNTAFCQVLTWCDKQLVHGL